MSIQITTSKQKVEFSKMVKDYKIRYYNLGPSILYIDYVDSTGTKTEAVPAYGSFTVTSNAGNAANSYLNLYTSSGTTNIVVSKIQQDCAVDGTDLFGNVIIAVDPADVDSLLQKTTNMAASSGVTTFTGTVNAAKFVASDSISIGSVELTQESLQETEASLQEAESNISNIQTDVSTLALSKLPYGTLYFNKGKLFGSNFTIPNFPFSICAQVRIDGWKGSSDVSQSIFQCGTYGSTQLVSLAFSDTSSFPRLGIQVSSTSDGTTTSSAFRCNFDYSDFIGKDHTIVAVCRNLDSSDTLDWSIYLDGEAMTGSPTKDLKIDALGGSVNYAVNTTNGNFPSNAACANPMRLSRLAVFNFDMSADGAPYTVADYVSGRLIPPALKPSQVSLALENYTIARNATTKLVKDASGNSNDATVQVSDGGLVAGDNDQSIKAFVDELKTQINQSNG